MERKLILLIFGLTIAFTMVFGNGSISSIEAAQDDIIIDSVKMVAVSNCFTNTDGELHIYASSGTAYLEYSLNGSAWQSTGDFTGLSGGVKNISIRDTSNIGDTKDTSIIFTSPAELIVDITKTDVIDTKGSVNIDATGGTGGLQYYLGSVPAPTYTATTNYPNLDTGLYYLSVIDANLCTYDTTIRIDTIVPLDVTITVLRSSSKCHPDNGTPDGYITIGLFDQTNVTLPLNHYFIGRGGNELVFEDIPDFITQNYNTLPADTFDLLVTDNSVPKRYYQDTIIITGPGSIVIGDTNIVTASCLNVLDGENDIGEIHISGITGGTSPYTYAWEHAYNPSPDVTGVSGGIYTVYVYDDNNCSSKNQIFVPYDINKQAVVHVDSLFDISCFNMDYSLEADTSKTDSYIWEKYDKVAKDWNELSGDSDIPTDTEWSLYRIVASNSYNCVDMDSIYLYIHPRFSIDIERDSLLLFTNDPDESITVNEDLKDNPYTLSYNWTALGKGINNIEDPTSAQTDFLVPNTQDDFIYVLTATSDLSCTETDTLFVFITKEIKIPSAFSPNNDQINDVWDLDFSKYYKTEITIFSRWGEILYHQPSAYNVSWDGNINGKPAPIGTYYYVVTVENEDESRTGPITIVR